MKKEVKQLTCPICGAGLRILSRVYQKRLALFSRDKFSGEVSLEFGNVVHTSEDDEYESYLLCEECGTEFDIDMGIRKGWG